MSADITRALVFGGSGAVGAEVVRALAARGAAVTSTYFRNQARASELPGEAVRVDLRDPKAIRELIERLCSSGRAPSVFVHCAVANRSARLTDATDDDYDDAFAVNVRAPYAAAKALAPHFAALGSSSVVFVGAMERSQSLPLPVHFAATQGALGAMAASLAKELGPSGARVNMISLGPLTTGVSRELPPALIEDYKRFSALHRLGTAEEAARAVVWLALDNRYMSGKTIAVNGGI